MPSSPDPQIALGRAIRLRREELALSQNTVALDAEIEERLADAERRIHAAQGSAMAAVRSVATDAASALIARLTASTPDSARVDRAVGAALAARGPG